MNNIQILSIIQELDLDTEFREFLQDSDEFNAPVHCFLTNWYEEHTFDEDEERVLALMEHTVEQYDDCTGMFNNEDYKILTDSEADDAWNEHLDNYLNDIILPELPKTAQQYFDRDSWISDAKMDGRGHSLSGYDGNEHEETINGTTYYIYRTN